MPIHHRNLEAQRRKIVWRACAPPIVRGLTCNPGSDLGLMTIQIRSIRSIILCAAEMIDILCGIGGSNAESLGASESTGPMVHFC